MSVVRIRNAHKYYNKGHANELHVMNDISLELPESGLVAIFGRSGCGKTTLLNAIGGLDKIAAGRIELFGKSIRENTDTVRNQYIGYIFQNYNLQSEETVYENVAAALRLCGMTDEREISARVTAALKNVGMDKYVARTPDTLSGGQQQRVAIARALVKNPAIILADEPTGNLDEANTVLVMDILKEISKTQLVLLVTHEANLVNFYCDRIIELSDGEVCDDRVNEGATGYVRRNRNDIYLGELEKTQTETPGVALTYYGAPEKTISLTIVQADGKLYLKCEDPTVKILEEGSEIRLREGVFNAQPAAEGDGENPNGHRIDMSCLTPVAGKHYGRLYHPKNAIAGAWRENFSRRPGRRRRGRGLRVILILIAVVLAFMSALIGTGIRDYIEVKEKHNDRLYYIPLDPSVDYSKLDLSVGRNGVTHCRIVGRDPLIQMDRLSFYTAAFMTAERISLSSSGFAQDRESMPELSLVAGTDVLQRPGEIVITTAIGDQLIESSSVEYIDSYRDLIGLSTDSVGNTRYRIVGVVRSSEAFYYMDGIVLARMILESYIGTHAVPLSDTHLDASIPEGGLLYIHWADITPEGHKEEPPYKKGDTVMIMGKRLTVTEVRILPYDDSDQVSANRIAPYVLNDRDYRSLAYTLDNAGSAEDGEGSGAFYDMWYSGSYVTYTNHLQIRSSAPEDTEAYLLSALGEGGYLTPDDMLNRALSEARRGALTNACIMLFFLALMCLCVFFVMRSSFMSRVREVGILRAIGVTRRNLLFRFAVETALLLLLTTVIAYTCTSFLIFSLADAPLFSTVFFFPPWLAICLLAVILAFGLLFGVLPAFLLLRKTPSEILAKYDI